MQRIDALKFAHDQMEKWGLTAQGWTFRFNERPRHRLGCCFGNRRIIELTGWYADTNESPVVFDTILHEIAHALAGVGKGHGAEWVEWCERVGCKPNRCKPINELNSFRTIWTAKCERCGRSFGRRTKPRYSRSCQCTRDQVPRPSLIWRYNPPPAKAANEVQTQPAEPDSVPSTIRNLLIDLGEARDPQSRKRIRAKLRRLGHHGGLL